MPYTTVFGPGTGANTSQLDVDLNEAGLLGTLPCSTTGTNALTLTPLTVPQPPFALQAMLRVSAIATASNTTGVTATVAGGPSLSVYKDTPTGPAVLTGGEIVSGNYFVLSYDAALNTGAGGWHLQTTPAQSLGTVTSVASGTGLTGGTITTTGTLALASIATLNLLANATGGSAAPTGNTLSAFLDAALATTSQGSILSRGASLWASNTEAAYTPVLSFGGGSTGITYATQVGQQMQIGYLTFAMFNVVLTSKGSSTGSAAISLPSTAGGSNRIGGGILTNYSIDSGVTTVPWLQISAGGTTAGFVVAGAGVTTALSNSSFGNASTFGGIMLYFTG